MIHFKNIASRLRYNIRQLPFKNIIAQKENNDWIWYTYNDLNNKINYCINVLKKNNINYGDNVVYKGKNSIDWIAWNMATYSIGAVWVPLYHNQNHEYIQHVLDDSYPKMFITDDYKNSKKYSSLIDANYKLNICKNKIPDITLSFQDNILSERDIKFKLANYPTNAECAVIGSSPILQISSYRKTRSFSSICDSILNLGTSGSVLEDYLIISEQLFLNKQPPKKIIISIYPYTLNFNRDKNWQKYSDEYYTFKNKLMNNKESNIISNKNSYNFLLLENLINLKYLIFELDLISS